MRSPAASWVKSRREKKLQFSDRQLRIFDGIPTTSCKLSTEEIRVLKILISSLIFFKMAVLVLDFAFLNFNFQTQFFLTISREPIIYAEGQYSIIGRNAV